MANYSSQKTIAKKMKLARLVLKDKKREQAIIHVRGRKVQFTVWTKIQIARKNIQKKPSSH